MGRKTKIKHQPIWVYTDENGFWVDFEIPRAALEWDDEPDFDQIDAIDDTRDALSELAVLNEN